MTPRYFRHFLAVALMLMAAVVASQSLYAQCVPPPSGMTAWWPLDEAAGPTANDIATGGINNAGTWIGAPAPVAGKVGGALSFSGSNSVDVPDHAELNFGTSDFSIDFWIKTTNASGTRTILDKRIGSVPNITGYVLFMSNGKLGSQIGDGAGYNNCVTTGFVADGNWHHVALTVDRNNSSGWRHYVDGNAVGTPANPTGWQGSLTNLAQFVMARELITPSNTFAGTLDEVELFNRVLDSLEVRSIWAAGSFGKCKDTCHSTGDANNDGVPLTVGDMSYLAGFINFCGPAPAVPYSCDLNGDGYVNSADLQLYQNYFLFGLSVFAPYGGYPVLCPCDPIPAPVPDTVRIFGIDHVSGGTACFDTTGGVLAISRIFENPRDTVVDANGDTIIVVSHPYKGRSGGGPYSTSISNLEDAGIAWSGDYQPHDTLFWPPSSHEVEVYGIVNGDSGRIAASTVQTNQADASWALGVKAAVTSYSVKAYLHGVLVKSVSNIAASGEWFQVGRFGQSARAESGGGPYSTSISNLEDAGIIVTEWESNDTVTWNWESQGVSGLEIDALRIEGKTADLAKVGYLSSVAQYAMNIPSFTMTAESRSMDYGGTAITPLGNATVTPVETTLVVSNIGSSGNDGINTTIDAEKNDNDGDWSITLANPDQSGTFPTGASLGTEFFFSTPTRPDTLSMGLSMTKAAVNNWNLAIQSGAAVCSVKAFNNGTQVYATSAGGTVGLGSIVETARGVYPVGFKGGSTGKPASIVASSDYNFTAGSGVLWTWAGHGVSSLPIDYLSISTEVPGTRLFGVTHTKMCGDNGAARSDPISFTILDIEVKASYVCGDANGDGTVDISDAVSLISYIFTGGPAPNPRAAGDANSDQTVDISDAVYLISYIFTGGPAPCAL